MRNLLLSLAVLSLLGGAVPASACENESTITRIGKSHWVCPNGLTVITKHRRKAIAVCATGKVARNITITPHNIIIKTEGMRLK